MGVVEDTECSFDDEIGFEIERKSKARFQGGVRKMDVYVKQQGFSRIMFTL
jgi:hypothetical protein